MAAENKKITILGFGVMGRQIAGLFQFLGYDVLVWNRKFDEDVKRRFETDTKLLRRKFASEQPSDESKEFGSVSFTSELQHLPIQLTIECLAEKLEVKHDIVGQLSRIVEAGLVLSNSSTIPSHDIHPQAGVLHFFNPLYAVRLIETDITEGSRPELQGLRADLKAAGFSLVPIKQNCGYIGNFLLFREISTAFVLLDKQGYSTDHINSVLTALGRASVFSIVDVVGTDTTLAILERLKEEDDTLYISPRLRAAVGQNILGKKNRTSIERFLNSSM